MTDGDASDREPTSPDASDGTNPETGRREIVVPLRLYKTITVFSTLIAIVGLLGGFVVLDVATDRAQADVSEVSVGLAVLGIAMIAFGAVVYAFSTRFRTERMENAKGDSDEHPNDG